MTGQPAAVAPHHLPAVTYPAINRSCVPEAALPQPRFLREVESLHQTLRDDVNLRTMSNQVGLGETYRLVTPRQSSVWTR